MNLHPHLTDFHMKSASDRWGYWLAPSHP